MFNWFRRQFGDSSQAEQTPVTPDSTPTVEESSQGEEVTQETETVADNSQDAYLEWAKSAFKNIQERKQSEEILETSEPVAEEVVSQEIESAIAEPEVEPQIELVVEAEPETVTESEVEPEIELVAETESVPSIELIVETESVTEVEPVPEIAEIEPENEIKPEISASTPAWLQKSDRLEILKETAIETEVPETPPQPVVRKKGIKFDDDFIWSAKVLADQGRAPEDISEEEINWLSRLRQGLTKTRRNLVNQLKAIVGQRPLESGGGNGD